MLTNGESSPNFALKDQDGVDYSLKGFLGKPLVLLFFRGIFCPSTVKALAGWQDFTRSLDDLGFSILAISGDTQENHSAYKESHGLSFSLLSDPDLVVSKKYGIYINFAETRGYFGEPGLVVIDSEGNVAYSVISSGPKGLPDPGAVASVLIYMSKRGGKY
jgi:peroxiredoxin